MLTFVLLPGMDGTGTLFEPFVAAIGRNMAIKVVHYPAEQDLGYEELQKVAAEALPEEGRFLLLGESFSGPLAVSLAASAGSRLCGLILCCSFVRSPRRVGAWIANSVLLPPQSFVPRAVVDYFLLGRFHSSALSASLRRAISQVAAHVLRRRLKAVLKVDVTDKLKAVRAPILYLRATEDRLVPPAASALVKEIAPQTHMVDIESPHCLLQAVPEKAAEAVKRFADEYCEG
jgi:pimeloyl-ACP methyl ester carboxylesterase